MQLLDHGANQLSAFNEMIGLDPLGGLEHEAGDDDAYADAGAVGWRLDKEALEFVITFVLPLGNDFNAVADLEGFVAAARDGLIHERR